MIRTLAYAKSAVRWPGWAAAICAILLCSVACADTFTLTRIACTGGSVGGSSGQIAAGTPVTVTAAPDPGYAFVGWTSDGCSGTSFVTAGPTYNFSMPASSVSLTAIFGKAKLIENFETYASDGVSIDSIDKNDSAGPNQSANGSERPWWGSNPPNGRVHSTRAHHGSKSLWGTAGNCKDLINLQYRLNSGAAFGGEVYLDWWFYDPLGQGGTSTDFCADYTALSYYPGVAANADYPSPAPNPMPASIQQLAIGMSDDLATGYEPTTYQVRLQGDPEGYHNGWFNTGTIRYVGWHHARIVVGPRKITGTNDVTFYVDSMAVPALGPRDSIATNGYNIIEVNTIMPEAGTCDSPNGCRYSIYYHFSSVDDISFGSAPAQPGPAAAGPVGTDRITWNWLDASGSEDGFEIWSAAAAGGLMKWTGPGATSAQETGMSANTRYSRWADSYLSQHCGSINSTRAPLPPTCTLALAPVYRTSGNAAITCNNGQGGTSEHLTGSPTTFTAVNGFGVGPARASAYRYIWDTSAGSPSDWGGSSEWTSGSLTKTASAAGSYYLHLRACNGDGVANTTTLNLGPYVYRAPISVARISDAWAYDDGLAIALTGKAVTAAFPNDSFWIEESDRTAAMRVLYPATSSAWLDHAVTIVGALDSSVRPRTFVATSVEDLGAASPRITPLALIVRSLGGIDFNSRTPGVTTGVGQYNVGLLVRVAGKVSFSDNTDPNGKFFYIDDGSAVASDGHAGVKVKCGAVDAPTSGTALVTGVISMEQSGGSYVPVLIRVSVD